MPIDWKKPIETDDGKPCRLICSDFKWSYDQNRSYIVLVKNSDCTETMHLLDKNGVGMANLELPSIVVRNKVQSCYINIYKDSTGLLYTSGHSYPDRSVADNAADNRLRHRQVRLACVKVREGQYDD